MDGLDTDQAWPGLAWPGLAQLVCAWGPYRP